MSDKQFKEMMLLAGVKPTKEVRAKSLNESVTVVFKRGSKRLMKESVQLNERNDVPSAFAARSKDRWTRGSTSIDQYNNTFVQEMKKLLDERPELAQGVNWKSESAVDALVRRLMNKYNIYEDVIFNGDDEANFMAAYKDHYGADLVDGTQVGPWYKDLTRKMMSVGTGLRESTGRSRSRVLKESVDSYGPELKSLIDNMVTMNSGELAGMVIARAKTIEDVKKLPSADSVIDQFIWFSLNRECEDANVDVDEVKVQLQQAYGIVADENETDEELNKATSLSKLYNEIKPRVIAGANEILSAARSTPEMTTEEQIDFIDFTIWGENDEAPFILADLLGVELP